MKYVIAMIVCLFATAAQAQFPEQAHHDAFRTVHRVVHHRVHHHHVHVVHRHHPHHINIPIPRPRPQIEDPMGNPFTSENTGIKYPYATGTSILDAFSGRAPVTYCEPTYPNSTTHVMPPPEEKKVEVQKILPPADTLANKIHKWIEGVMHE